MAKPWRWLTGESDKVPERSWDWTVNDDPACFSVEKTITLGANGLSYMGWCDNPCYGGGYTIGFQTVDEFLERGPLDEQLPSALVEEIRGYLVENPRPTAAIKLVAVVADQGRIIEHGSAGLDGVPVTPGLRPLLPGREVTLFAGSIGLGDHVVRAGFTTRGAGPEHAFSQDETFTIGVGDRLRVVFTVEGWNATVAISRSSDT